MKSNSYLYGEDAEIPEIPAEVIVRRIEILNEQLEEELDKHYSVRDNARVNNIAKAIVFWETINEQ